MVEGEGSQIVATHLRGIDELGCWIDAVHRYAEWSIGIDHARAWAYRADLARRGRLVRDGDGIGAANGDLRCEFVAAARGDAQRLRAIALQGQAQARQARDGNWNGAVLGDRSAGLGRRRRTTTASRDSDGNEHRHSGLSACKHWFVF